MIYLYVGLAAAACILSLYILYVWHSQESLLKNRQMDLFLAEFFQWLAALFGGYALQLGVWPDTPLIWLAAGLMIVLMIIGRMFLSSLKGRKLSDKAIHSFEKPFLFLFSWIPKIERSQGIELTKQLLDPQTKNEIAEQREVLENALDLGQTTLDEICTHRSDMVVLSMKDDPSKWKQVIQSNRHTFYPVSNESEDDIIGILDTRDYFRLDGYGKKNILDHCVDKPMFATENTTADELLRMMKNRRNYIAIVLDEYGGVVGLVTLHDIIEELFGELSEEEEKRQAEIVRLPRGVWRIAGEANLKDVSKALGIPLELDDFETFSGYVLGSIGYIPDDGSQLEVQIGKLIIQIKRIAGHRIRQTLVRLADQSGDAESAPDNTPARPAAGK